MANPAPTINQINAFNATQGTTIDFNIIGGTELIRSNRIYIYDLSDNSLICTHLYVSTESIHELPPNTDGSIVYESGKSSADFVNGAQYYAQIQTYTDTNGTQGGSGLSVAKMFWCLGDPTLTITTIPSTISTTSYNISATYTDTSASVVSNIIQQYQFNLYSATGSLLQSSGVVVGSGTQQGTSATYDISHNFTGLNVGSSYYVTVDVTTTQGMSVTTQSNTFTVSIDTPTLGEATVVNNACDGYISVTSNLSGEYGGSGSGEIVSFETDSENVFSKLKVDLEPTQNLNGYSYPWVGGAGKNKLQITGAGRTFNGITFTVNSDGSVTINGTSTAGNAFVNLNYSVGVLNLPVDTPIVLAMKADKPTSAIRMQVAGSASSDLLYIFSTSESFAVSPAFTIDSSRGDTATWVRLQIPYSGTTIDNVTVYPMWSLASDAPTEWEPYENICPINGQDEASASVVGKNFLEVKKGASGTAGEVTATVNEDGSITINGAPTNDTVVIGNLATGFFGTKAEQNDGKKHIPNGQYIITTGVATNTGVRLQLYGTNQSSGTDDINAIIQVQVESTLTIDDTYAYNYARLFVEAGTYSNVTIKPMIRLASETDSTYELYNGQTYTTALGRTVYGGTIDLASGTLVVDRFYFLGSALAQSAITSISTSDGKTRFWLCRGLKTHGKVLCNQFESITEDVYTNFFTNYTIGVYDDPTLSQTYPQSFGICAPSSVVGTTATEIYSWLQSSGVEFVAYLATPQTYQLTPQQVNTLVGTNNVWSEQGNIELSYHIPITNLLVKRQDVDDVSGGWLTLYSQPISQASDMDFTFIDFLNQYGKTYKYALVPLLTQTQSGVEVEVEGGYTVSDEVQSVFDGVFIADSTGSQKCKANVGYGNVDMNQVVGSITPIGAKYPIIVTNSHNQYHNGSISGTIVPDDYYFNGNLSRIDMVNKRNELEQFLTNKRVKVIKDWNGNIWLVMIVGNVSCTFNNNYGMGIVDFSTNWTEVGDPTNQQDLQATGLINVGGV